MWSVLITCEHARGGSPPEIELGLPEDVLASHVSMDRGARHLATTLAAALGAPLHLGAWSRLVVDLNRRAENPTVILDETYGLTVPGNRSLAPEERARRIATYHRPYREAARADALQAVEAGGCLHLSVHSFDPAVDPPRRQFDGGVLFDTSREPEASVAQALADAIGARGRDIRLNAPYAGVPEGLTSWLRSQTPAARYIGIELEASQRWMREREEIERFASDSVAGVAAVLELLLIGS